MKYELSFIISGAVPENEHQVLEKEVWSYLDKAGVTGDKRLESLGRKKLAYSIKKQKHGFYLFIRFDLENQSALKELDTNLRHNHNILRHLIVKLEPSALKVPKPRMRPLPKAKVPETVGMPKHDSLPKLNLDDLTDIDKKLDDILDREPEI